jgi:hypothetical protein
MIKAETIGFAIGLLIFIISIYIKPEAVCHDGWKSPSIGIQGACSHHGGVNYHLEYPLIGFIVGSCAGSAVYTFLNKKRQAKFDLSKSKLAADIEDAIKTGRKITFLYKRPSDRDYKLRTIKPISFVKYQHKRGNNYTLCIKGLCDLIKSERSFALKRIKDLKIL